MTEEYLKMGPEEYIKNRLDNQIEWYSKKSGHCQLWYKRLKKAEIIMAAAIPVILMFSDGAFWTRIAAAILGALITEFVKKSL